MLRLLSAATAVEPGSPTSIVLFALVSLAVVGAVATVLVRARHQQRRDQPRPDDDPRGPVAGPGGS